MSALSNGQDRLDQKRIRISKGRESQVWTENYINYKCSEDSRISLSKSKSNSWVFANIERWSEVTVETFLSPVVLSAGLGRCRMKTRPLYAYSFLCSPQRFISLMLRRTFPTTASHSGSVIGCLQPWETNISNQPGGGRGEEGSLSCSTCYRCRPEWEAGQTDAFLSQKQPLPPPSWMHCYGNRNRQSRQTESKDTEWKLWPARSDNVVAPQSSPNVSPIRQPHKWMAQWLT